MIGPRRSLTASDNFDTKYPYVISHEIYMWSHICERTSIPVNDQLNFNLTSLTRMLIVNGWKVTKGDKTGIQIAKGDHVIDFNIVILTPKGAVLRVSLLEILTWQL